MKSYLTGAVVLLAGAASAQVVIPSAFASTSTGTTGFNTVMRQFDRSMQAVYSASVLGLNVGDQINGISFRMNFTASNAFTTFPANTLTFANYDIFMSTTSVTPGSMSTTYAANQGGDFMQVRSGSLTVSPNTYTKGPDAATPGTWGSVISFNNAFTYNGGNLLIEIRHTGNGDAAGNMFIDTVADSAGSWQAIANTTSGSAYTATTGTVGATAAPVARLNLAPVPEPASMTVLGLGALALLRKRRAKKA